jgi:hypothetical protein
MSGLARAQQGLLASLQKGRTSKEVKSKQLPLQAQAALGPEVSSEDESSEVFAPWAEPAVAVTSPVKFLKKPNKHSSSTDAATEIIEVRQLHHQSRVAQAVHTAPTDGNVNSSSSTRDGGMFERLRVRSEHRRQQDTAVVNDFETKLTALSEALEVRVLDASHQLRAGLDTIDQEVQTSQAQLNEVICSRNG